MPSDNFEINEHKIRRQKRELPQLIPLAPHHHHATLVTSPSWYTITPSQIGKAHRVAPVLMESSWQFLYLEVPKHLRKEIDW